MSQDGTPATGLTMSLPPDSAGEDGLKVRHFRQIVLWPLQIMQEAGKKSTNPEELLQSLAPGRWERVEDEFGHKAGALQERHYREFVSFLPHVQRFLYGDATEGGTGHVGNGDAPLRIYRRNDVREVQLHLRPGLAPVRCRIAHVDLHFFHDVDAVILACEIEVDDIALRTAKEIMYRFGRAYPPGWTEAGEPLHCPAKVEWIGAGGAVLAVSDYGNHADYLSFVGQNRAPRISAHWEFLLAPMVSHAASPASPLRYRQIEYYRMPLMAFLVMDHLTDLCRADFIRLAFATGPGAKDDPPYAQSVLQDFEARHCYDRFFHGAGKPGAASTRFLTCGHAFTVLAGGNDPWLQDRERGLLGQFRHQYFLLFLISHFHKASMLMLKDRLVATITRLDSNSPKSVGAFRREVYRLQELFMRFTQRYWFTEVSDQVQARDLFRMQITQLGNEAFYRELRSQLFDTVQYLDSDMLRRQSSSMHRLTTVTILGLIGTTVTGFLGMNLIAEAEAPLATKIWLFGLVSGAVVALTALTLAVSARLTRLFDKISGEGS